MTCVFPEALASDIIFTNVAVKPSSGKHELYALNVHVGLPYPTSQYDVISLGIININIGGNLSEPFTANVAVPFL